MPNKTVKCINGDLQTGDLVISTWHEEYSYLVGNVLEINLVGSPEHEMGTANETNDENDLKRRLYK